MAQGEAVLQTLLVHAYMNATLLPDPCQRMCSPKLCLATGTQRMIVAMSARHERYVSD